MEGTKGAKGAEGREGEGAGRVFTRVNSGRSGRLECGYRSARGHFVESLRARRERTRGVHGCDGVQSCTKAVCKAIRT